MTTPSKDGTVKFTSRDIEQLAKAFGCMKAEIPGLDYQKFALACGFANANSAKASWHSLKKKIDKVAGGNVNIST
jgi:Ca2+-binding EF-hand superfamily protein